MITTIVIAVIAFVIGVCVGASIDVDDPSNGNVNDGGIQINGNGDNVIEINSEELSNGTGS